MKTIRFGLFVSLFVSFVSAPLFGMEVAEIYGQFRLKPGEPMVVASEFFYREKFGTEKKENSEEPVVRYRYEPLVPVFVEFYDDQTKKHGQTAQDKSTFWNNDQAFDNFLPGHKGTGLVRPPAGIPITSFLVDDKIVNTGGFITLDVKVGDKDCTLNLKCLDDAKKVSMQAGLETKIEQFRNNTVIIGSTSFVWKAGILNVPKDEEQKKELINAGIVEEKDVNGKKVLVHGEKSYLQQLKLINFDVQASSPSTSTPTQDPEKNSNNKTGSINTSSAPKVIGDAVLLLGKIANDDSSDDSYVLVPAIGNIKLATGGVYVSQSNTYKGKNVVKIEVTTIEDGSIKSYTGEYLVTDNQLDVMKSNKRIKAHNGKIFTVDEQFKTELERAVKPNNQLSESKINMEVPKRVYHVFGSKIVKQDGPTYIEFDLQNSDQDNQSSLHISLTQDFYTHVLMQTGDDVRWKEKIKGEDVIVEIKKSQLDDCKQMVDELDPTEKTRLGLNGSDSSLKSVLYSSAVIIGGLGIAYLLYSKSPQYGQGFVKYLSSFWRNIPGFNAVAGLFN